MEPATPASATIVPPAAKKPKLSGGAATAASEDTTKEIDLPAPALNKLLKIAVPDAVASKDAKLALSKAAGIFIMYITSCCNDIAKESKRSTVQPQDVLAALKELGFDLFIPQMQALLEEQKEVTQKRREQRKQQSQKLAAAAAAAVTSKPADYQPAAEGEAGGGDDDAGGAGAEDEDE
jgi:DNA polymerase epsilon subunit 3